MRIIKINLALILAIALLFFGETAAQKAETNKPASPAMPSEIADDGVPVLIKNLPNWEAVRNQAVFAKTLAEVEKIVGKNAALEAVSFESAETIIAPYEVGKLAIVEFQTPQFAIENDARIAAKIEELKQSGQIAPVYRKVGNYAVFVFDTKDESAANALIDQVKYEKVVQWLGQNPYLLQRAERDYVNTMGGVVLTVIYTSGMALLAALLIGGVFGTWIFYLRRRETVNNFSDAGGMMRLNLDDLSMPDDSRKFLKD